MCHFYPLILKYEVTELYILKLSINSSDKGISKDLCRDRNPLKLRHKGVTYVTTDKLLSKVM